MEDEQTFEDMKKAAILEKVIIPKVSLENGKEIDPFIIITLEDKKIGIYMNKIKIYRTINKKNQIEGVLDIFLVDTIKELLAKLAEREQATEELNKKEIENEREFRKSSGTAGNDRKTGQSGTSPSDRFV